MGSRRVLAVALGALVALVLATWSLLPLGLGLLLPLYTRLGRDRLLQDGVRPRIVELLRAEPGLGITDVCARLAIGWGTAVHHLTRLEQAGIVVSQDAGRRRRFFLPDESAARRAAVCVLSSDLNRRLVELVGARPGLTQQEVCGALGISAPLTHKYLARLIHGGFVHAEREWRLVRYYPSDRAASALAEYHAATGTPRGEGLSSFVVPASPPPNGGPPSH